MKENANGNKQSFCPSPSLNNKQEWSLLYKKIFKHFVFLIVRHLVGSYWVVIYPVPIFLQHRLKTVVQDNMLVQVLLFLTRQFFFLVACFCYNFFKGKYMYLSSYSSKTLLFCHEFYI